MALSVFKSSEQTVPASGPLRVYCIGMSKAWNQTGAKRTLFISQDWSVSARLLSIRARALCSLIQRLDLISKWSKAEPHRSWFNVFVNICHLKDWKSPDFVSFENEFNVEIVHGSNLLLLYFDSLFLRSFWKMFAIYMQFIRSTESFIFILLSVNWPARTHSRTQMQRLINGFSRFYQIALNCLLAEREQKQAVKH